MIIGHMKPAELKEMREEMGLTQGQLAEALGVHRESVNRWENEARRIPSMLQLAMERLRTKKEKKPHGKK